MKKDLWNHGIGQKPEELGVIGEEKSGLIGRRGIRRLRTRKYVAKKNSNISRLPSPIKLIFGADPRLESQGSRMKTNFQRSSRCWIGLLEGLAVAAMITSPAFAQTGDISTQTASSSDILAQYVEGQWTLTEGLQTLSLEGATDAQIEAWLQRNATQFQAQQQLSQILAMASALQPMMVGDSVTIPSGASGALVNFLTTSASLGNAFAEIHNQLLASMPAGATQADIDWMEQQAQQTFQQQNVGNLQLQVQQAQALGAASASIPLPVPGPAVIPSNATPELQAYLTARNALAAARAQIWNQYVTADPGVRDAAMRQWDRQNIAAIQQVSALAQALANSTANQ